MKPIELLAIAAGAYGLYYLYEKNHAAAALPVATSSSTAVTPAITTPVATTPSSLLTSASTSLSNLVNQLTGSTPAATVIAPAVLSPNNTTQAATVTPPVSTIPPAPALFNLQYYLTYQYPAMLAANPNVGNPNYILTDAEAQQYINNYAILQNYPGDNQPLSIWLDGVNAAGVYSTNDKNNLDHARMHWKLYGVANQYSFMPFTPYDDTPPKLYPPLPTTTVPKKSGNIFSSVLSGVEAVAPIAVALAGVSDLTERLDPREAGILITGGGLMLDVLSLYFAGANGDTARDIYTEYHDLLTQYVK